MSWVAVGTTAVGVAGSYLKADANKGGGGAGSGGGFSSPSAASYGTNLGNDGWSINFGSGTQVATPSETNTASYPQQANPLNQIQPQQVIQNNDPFAQAAGISPNMLLLAVGALVVVKALRK